MEKGPGAALQASREGQPPANSPLVQGRIRRAPSESEQPRQYVLPFIESVPHPVRRPAVSSHLFISKVALVVEESGVQRTVFTITLDARIPLSSYSILPLCAANFSFNVAESEELTMDASPGLITCTPSTVPAMLALKVSIEEMPVKVNFLNL